MKSTACLFFMLFNIGFAIALTNTNAPEFCVVPGVWAFVWARAFLKAKD